MRAIWKGTISFGLVSIAVRLAPATTDRDVHFRTLHERCHTPIQYRRWCPTCNREVPSEELTYGYEFRPGEYVPVATEERQALRPTTPDHALNLLDFVHLAEIDPIYFEKTYYLEPGEGGLKPYILLHQTLKTTQRIGIGTFTLRAKESLAALRVYGPILALTTLFYPDEVRPLQELSGLERVTAAQRMATATGAAAQNPAVRLDPRELDMATRLVDSLTVPFDPTRYISAERQRLEEWLQEKLAQAPAPRLPAPAAAGRGDVADLLQALEASLAATRRRSADSSTAAPAHSVP